MVMKLLRQLPWKRYALYLAVVSIVDVSLTLLVGYSITHVLSMLDETTAMLHYAIIGMIAFTLLQGFVAYRKTVRVSAVSLHHQGNLQLQIMEALSSAKYSAFEQYTASDVLKRIHDDARRIALFFSDVMFEKVVSIFVAIGAIAYCAFVSWQLTLATYLLAPLLIYIANKVSLKIMLRFKKQQEISAQLETHWLKSLTSHIVVKAYNASHAVQQDFMKNSQMLAEHQIGLTRNREVTIFLSWIGFAVPTVVLFGYGAYLIATNQLTIGQWTAFFYFTTYAVSLTEYLPVLLTEGREMKISLARIQELQDIPPETGTTLLSVKPSYIGNVYTMKQVQFSYDRKTILKNITFSISRGEKVVLCGKNGCGKSTLITLLMQLRMADHGEIAFFGQSMSAIMPLEVRKRVSIVEQHPYLFEGSVLDNIAIAAPAIRHDSDALNLLIHKSALFEFSGDSNLLLQQVGEGGKLLSGGQRQRIALARALARQTEVLLLDEATSAVPSDIEKVILEELLSDEELTVIAVAHNLYAYRNFSRFVLLDGGKIALDGKFDTLRDSPLFQELIREYDEACT